MNMNRIEITNASITPEERESIKRKSSLEEKYKDLSLDQAYELIDNLLERVSSLEKIILSKEIE